MIEVPTIGEPLPALLAPTTVAPVRHTAPIEMSSLLSYQDDAEAEAQVRAPSSVWRSQVRQAVSRAVLEGQDVPAIEAGLLSDVAASTTVPRAEAEAIVRQDVAAAVAAVAPRQQSPELVGPMPTGAEHAKPIRPAGLTPATEPTAPLLAMPRPNPEDEALITLPAPETALAPQGWLAEPPTTQTIPAPVTPPLPTPPTFAQPAAVAPPAPGTAGLPWLHLGVGVGMAAVGIYLLTKRKKG